jgi:ABC-type nitrate/sulfonate/bicarbonate transport system substrate-binding protein
MTKGTRIFAAGAAVGHWAKPGIGLALLLMALPGAAVASDKIVLQLHRQPQFEFAGYYAALWKGFYKEAGLDVEIRPGSPPGAAPVDAMREVIERRARFGTGTAQLLVHAAQGAPLVLHAPIFQESDAAVYYRSDTNFSSPRVLLTARIGRLPPSNILDAQFRAALRSEGIDADKLKSVSLEPAGALPALADRRVDAVVGSAWELPWQARERSVAVKSLSLADYGPRFYGDGLFTSQRFANADPTTAQRFRDASIKGWQYALQHPDEIAGRIAAELTAQPSVADPAAFVRYQSEVARRLARFPDVPLGQSSPARWEEIQQVLIAVGAMSRTADLNAFLYKPGAQSSGFVFMLALPIFFAIAVLALFAAAGRWLWSRYRSSAASAQVPHLAALHNRQRLARDWTGLFSGLRPGIARFRGLVQMGFSRARQIAHQLALSTGGGRPRIRPTDLNTTLMGLKRSIGKRLPDVITCRFSLLPDVWLCEADAAALTPLILDLVAEAAAFMPTGGKLVVGTRHYKFENTVTAEFPGSAPGDYVRMTVRDSGRGLSPAGLERVFYPKGTARPAAAAAWQLTRRLGGFAAVESAEGVGTAVHLYFRRSVALGENPSSAADEDVHALAAE